MKKYIIIAEISKGRSMPIFTEEQFSMVDSDKEILFQYEKLNAMGGLRNFQVYEVGALYKSHS